MAFNGAGLNETQHILLRAKDLISNPEQWCQGHFGRDGNSAPCDIDNAVTFCALGSLMKVFGDTGEVYDWLDLAAEDHGYSDAVKVNDESDHATVMAMYDRAIELAGEGQ